MVALSALSARDEPALLIEAERSAHCAGILLNDEAIVRRAEDELVLEARLSFAGGGGAPSSGSARSRRSIGARRSLESDAGGAENAAHLRFRAALSTEIGHLVRFAVVSRTGGRPEGRRFAGALRSSARRRDPLPSRQFATGGSGETLRTRFAGQCGLRVVRSEETAGIVRAGHVGARLALRRHQRFGEFHLRVRVHAGRVRTLLARRASVIVIGHHVLFALDQVAVRFWVARDVHELPAAIALAHLALRVPVSLSTPVELR